MGATNPIIKKQDAKTRTSRKKNRKCGKGTKAAEEQKNQQQAIEPAATNEREVPNTTFELNPR